MSGRAALESPPAATPGELPAETAELAAGFIHEIKNHLGTLSLNLQLLAEDFEEPETPRERKALERVTRLSGECQKLVELSNDFLRFARLRELHARSVALDEIVSELIDFFGPTAQKWNIEIRWFPGPDLRPVRLDPDLFKQALVNLVLNAEQAMPDGGTLTLIGRCEGETVYLEVIDTGAGIAPEAMAKLFRPFHTTKPDGSGLGLATTRKIVLAHGGTIEAQSEQGRGTKFTIALPAAG
jgi:signal transduction histidine kinase